jgi:hypothetical protein
MRVERDFEELFELFSKHEVRYCIVGAYAVGFYARPRYTKDIDVFVGTAEDNARRIVAALDEFGFGSLGLTERDFRTPGVIIQLGYEPLRIDLITSIEGLEFDQVWGRRRAARYGRQEVFFISLEDLITAKGLSSRTQDQADLELLTDALNRQQEA